jgi:hypothetical protein
MLPIPNCITSPSEYANNGSLFFCPECMTGSFPTVDVNGNPTCKACYGIEYCADCSDSSTCTECDSGYILQPDGSACIEPFEDCLLTPNEYDIDESGLFWCSDCADGMIWNVDECDDCSEVFDNCSECSLCDNCTKCEDETYQMSPDGNCYSSIANCVTYQFYEDDDDFDLVCQKCI